MYIEKKFTVLLWLPKLPWFQDCSALHFKEESLSPLFFKYNLIELSEVLLICMY